MGRVKGMWKWWFLLFLFDSRSVLLEMRYNTVAVKSSSSGITHSSNNKKRSLYRSLYDYKE